MLPPTMKWQHVRRSSHVPQHIRSLFRTTHNLQRIHWSGISRRAVQTFQSKYFLLSSERKSNQIWAITLGHRAITYVPRHHIAGITKIAKPKRIRCECVGELLQLPDAVGYVLISLHCGMWVVYLVG